MKIKSLLISTTVATSLLLGACGNMDDKDVKKSDDNKMESKMDKKDNMKDSKSNKMMKEGMFKGENKQMVEGKAMIKDNKLMLTDFKSSKGPDLHVYLTKNGMKIDKVMYDKKEQTFDLKDVDMKDYDSVTIYCDKAHVVFGNAMLK
ncbi:DM13 domain-containing protein [Staphylococcus pettenkoferi]|uniref:DM13 domain-containing protein n=1 Tax=Staphylococcus pettenkoferi TaxID=170573 RepID=UPI0022755323|nr:DM13 domain-containing protein [Staphylococcus pettenkoferi]MCY1592690.1 DM13 domain-containing protein [Staphylococcus pettenkoferi]MCY1597376.1 DM13 domain-containing protein [Staphylococcus pettenkoferi]MCY1610477.1 DM13 domain-containing protein [Staphylococcus pettenkoferi]MCY1623920.1 DM13 domain-containing protein [Staphylococcus pettenkoferi]